LLVDLNRWPDRRAPSLHPHYQASPLLRARPPLRLASVLGSSWVHHLEVSLRIEARSSHVPHKSLHWAHAVFMPVAARAVSRHPPSFIPGRQQEPGFGDIPELSTPRQRFTLVRLPSAYLTGQRPPFPETLTTPAIGPEQLSVVWTLALQPESGGPTPISCTARLLQAATSASFPRLRGALSAVQFRPWAPRNNLLNSIVYGDSRDDRCVRRFRPGLSLGCRGMSFAALDCRLAGCAGTRRRR
jgi:hypothetical protein